MADRYKQLFEAAVAAYPDTKKQKVQTDVNLVWKEIKAGRKDYLTELKQFKDLGTRAKSNLMSFWAPSRKRKPSETTASTSEIQFVRAIVTTHVTDQPSSSTDEQPEPAPKVARSETPVQRNTKEELSKTEKRIADLHIVKSSVGLSEIHAKELTSLVQKKADLEKKIKRLKSLQAAQ